jgi:hypothetical protein
MGGIAATVGSQPHSGTAVGAAVAMVNAQVA